MSRIRKFNQLFLKDLKNSNLLNYAAQLSYGMMLAFIPLLMLFNFAIQFLSRNSQIQTQIYHFISSSLPPYLSGLILPTLTKNTYNPLSNIHALAANFTLLAFIIYASTRLIRLFTRISTAILKERERVNLIVSWLLALRDLIFIIICLIIIFGSYLEFQLLISDFLLTLDSSVYSSLSKLFEYATYAYLIIMLFFVLNWCMAKLPLKSLKFFSAVPGSILTLAGWIFISLLFKFMGKYLNYEGWTQAASQGIKILITIYMVSISVLLGELFNRTLMSVREYNLLRGSKRYD